MVSSTEIYTAVNSHYSAASSGRTSNGTYESTVAKAFGYTLEELTAIPEDANLGLSCGNPHVLADLRQGEVVVDLGSGAGFDVFLAARKVGATGKAIGVDMNRDMLRKANVNKDKSGVQNVEFVEAQITDITPLKDGSVDCIISNCVVNLVPEEEKHLVFKEMFRLLKSGGRVAISDILIRDDKDLPASLKSDMGLLVGCIAGASPLKNYERYLREAGFEHVLVVDNHKDLNVYKSDDNEEAGQKSCCGTTVQVQKSCCGTTVPVTKSCCGTQKPASPESAAKPTCGGNSIRQTNGNQNSPATIYAKDVDFNEYAGSYNVYAVKS